jgi:hypothetical protein
LYLSLSLCGEWIMRSLWKLEENKRPDAAQLLFLSCLHSEKQECRFLLLQCQPLPEKCCSTSLITTGYKRLAEGGPEVFWWKSFFNGDFDRLLLPLAVVTPPEQLSVPRTLYIGFRKAKLKKR